MIALEKLSAAEIGELVNSKAITPTEVVEYFYNRIEALNPKLNAIVYTRLDEAKQKAKEIEMRLAKGEYVGPFAGVPFAMKDFLPSKKGWTNSKGGVKSLIEVDDHDSAFTVAMEKAGGIALGKTNAPSYGFSGLTDNKLYGPTSNPFALDRNSGGSSGGSAASVAGGLIPIAEGGDAGGSIRIPASWTNLFGFKASVGSIPSVCRPDAWAATHPYCFGGGLTKTVQDAAILMNFMIKNDPRDPLCIEKKPLDFTKEMTRSIKGKKIAFTYDFGLFEVEEEIKEKVFEAAEKLEAAGASIALIDFHINRTLEELFDMWCLSISADTAIELELRKKAGFDVYEKCKDELPTQFLEYNKRVYNASLMDIYRFNVIRTELFDAFQDVFDEYDYILSPLACCHPVKNGVKGTTLGPKEINGKPINRLLGFSETFLVNFVGNPAASIPVGLSHEGFPIGMQAIGRRFHDDDVFALAGTFERISPWREYFDKIKL